MSAFSLIHRKLHNLTHPELGQILMLHRVTEQRSRLLANRELEVTPDFLEQTILRYKEKGYRFVDMDEVARVVKGGKQKQKFVCFTFDDGYADNYTLAFPIFKKYNCPFTINITTDFYERKALLWWYVLEDLGVTDVEFHKYRAKIFDMKQSDIKIAFQNWFPNDSISFEKKVDELALTNVQIKELSDSELCTIGNHTISHPCLNNLSLKEQVSEMSNAQYKLEQLIGKPVTCFAYPYGYYNDDSIVALNACNISLAMKTWGGVIRRNDDRLTLNRIILKQS